MEINPSSSSRADRKTIERNRRNHMKALYSKLNSLLPHHHLSTERVSLPDQLDEAAEYIKQLEVSVERKKETKKRLMGIERSSSSSSNGSSMTPRIEVHEMGSAFQVVLVTGVDHRFLFREMIGVIHEEGGEIVSATFSEVDDGTIFHTIHSKVDESTMGYRAAVICMRLKKVVQDVSPRI